MRVQEAKDFLVQEIAAEARAQGTPLSGLERQMLYFTESGDADEDPVALYVAFEAQYDTTEFEKKISHLMAVAHRRIIRESPEKLRSWNEAFRVLGKGDHYILIFWRQAKRNKSYPSWKLYLFIGFSVVSFYLVSLFLFGSKGDLLRGKPAPIDKFIPALSPSIQHVLQLLFLLLVLLAIFPQLYSKFVNACLPQAGSKSLRKRLR